MKSDANFLKFLNYLLIPALALVIYGPFLNNAPSFDDLIWFGDESRIASKTFFEAIFSSSWPGNLYRPTNVASFKLNELFFSENFTLWRLTNLALHIANGILVFRYFKRLIGPNISIFGALLFISHPMGTEVVMSIANRTELLSLFFILVALNFQKSFLVVFIATLLGFLAKESSYFFLALVCLFATKDRTYWKALVATSLAALISISLRIYILGGLTPPGFITKAIDNILILKSFYEKAIASTFIVFSYFKNFFFPINLSPDYSYAQFIPPLTLGDPAFILSALTLLTTAFLCWKSNRLSKKINPTTLFLWSILSLVAASNLFITIGTIFADRLFYSGMVPTAILLSLTLSKAPRLASSSLGVIILIATTSQSFNYSKHWDGNESLFAYTVKVSPKSFRANTSYASALSDKGEFTTSLHYADKALAIFPNSQEILLLVAHNYEKLGNKLAYRRSLEELLRHHPKHGPGLLELANFLLKEGEIEQAKTLLQDASQRESVKAESLRLLRKLSLSPPS